MELALTKRKGLIFMTKLNRTTKLNFALAIGLIVAIITSPFTVFAKECNQIRNEVLRLHIIPNSNTQEDQQIKLIIRDKILEIDEELFLNAGSRDNAIAIAKENLEYIKKTASDTLASHGFTYGVNVEVCKMYFTTREYDTFTLPAGRYDAIRITLGEAKGNNWWCVLYPTLCVPAASKRQNLDDVLTKSQQEIIEGKSEYEIRFASVELWEKIKQYFSDKDE